MDKFRISLAIVGALMILSQWFVFTSMRRYLFQNYEAITRKTAYLVLSVLGLANLGAVMLAIGSDWFPPGTYERKVATVLFFSYLGLVLTMSLFFLVLRALSQVLNLKDAVTSIAKKILNRSGSLPEQAEGDSDSTGSQGVGASAQSALTLGTSEELQIARPAALNAEPEGSGRISRIPSHSRRTFLKWSTATGLVGALGYAGHGMAEAFRDPVVEEFHLKLPELAGLKRPVTFLHITDFHFGLFFGTGELERLVEKTNAMDGDALFITGDVFHSQMSQVMVAGPVLEKLKPRRFGNFVVLGNHDFYAGEWRTMDTLHGSGLTLLRDQWVTLDTPGAKIHLGGIDDPLANWIWGKDFPGFKRFMEGVPSADGVKILLSHRPSVLPLAAESDIDLVFAGHIHGGQVILPTGNSERGLSLARLASPYTHGWYSESTTRMYLNRGVGLTFVPWRINCPSEIAVVHVSG
jgi:predicted MPP superfamily phosphohydrolase